MKTRLALHEIAQAAAACRDFYRGEKGQPGLPARLLKLLFDRLSRETQLWLARDVTVEMTAFVVTIKDRFGEDATATVDGDVVKIGVKAGDNFHEIGRGGTWKEALQAAEEHDD